MFDKLIGNEEMKERLRKLAASGRIPQAILFSGQEGIGKLRFAMDLAASFVCETKIGCGECKACRRALKIELPNADDKDAFQRVISSEHPDVGLVTAYKRNLLVEAIRDLEREAHFRPYEAGSRVFIINDAHKMNEAASNALLKTLEEPPETTYLFLVTSRPEKLLQTIRSRCQSFRFVPVAAAEIEKFLGTRGKYSGDKAKLAARICGGNIGRALSIDIEKYLDMRSMMVEVLLSAASGRKRASMLQISEQINDAAHKDDFEEVLDVLESLIRDVWLILNDLDTDEIANVDIADNLASIGENCTSGAARRLARRDRNSDRTAGGKRK